MFSPRVMPTLACVVALLCSLAAAQGGGLASDYGKPTPVASAPTSLPTVDLGYELHKALSFNATGGYYNFTNIRYATPPVGDLRFRAPQPPIVERSVVQDGSLGRICPQAIPQWTSLAQKFLTRYFTNQPNNLTMADIDRANNSLTASTLPKQDIRTTEDCLFLDVLVPENIFDQKDIGKGSAVIVWIYGGGYTEGDKSQYKPAGLIYNSLRDPRGGVIYVALNYRLGAFGWLGGPTFQTDGTANAALHDQRMALQWVQKYIHLFGGDKGRVTVVGESAGGGSIMHQLTAYGGTVPAPFQQAVPQSAAFQPLVSNFQNEATFNNFMTLAGVSTLKQLRALPEQKLIEANILQVGHSGYGSFTYGPTVDGTFVPALPGQLMLQGNYNKNVTVMTGKNSNEGILFTDPLVLNDTALTEAITLFLPTISPQVLDYVTKTLYPPAPHSEGNLSYTTETGRYSAAIGEGVFQCNSFYMDTAYTGLNQAYGYYFEVPFGYHGEDIGYTFYDNTGPSLSSLLLNTTVAVALQDYITTFAQNGAPSSPDVVGLPKFAMYGADASVQDLGLTNLNAVTDPNANSRCQWWQKALYV